MVNTVYLPITDTGVYLCMQCTYNTYKYSMHIYSTYKGGIDMTYYIVSYIINYSYYFRILSDCTVAFTNDGARNMILFGGK